MNEYPLISIIVPIYNVADYLDKCIESCLNQSYPNFEVIAVNDGSQDRSGEKLEYYAKKDNRLTVLAQPNSGVVAARNRAIASSKGEYLFFVDGDDYIAINALELLYSKLTETKADIVIGGICRERNGRFTPLQNKLPYGDTPIHVIAAMLVEQQQLSLYPKLIPRRYLDEISIHDLTTGEDVYMILQIIGKATKVSVVDAVIYYYVYRSVSVVNKPSGKDIDSFLEYLVLTEGFLMEQNYNTDIFFSKCLSCFMLNQYFHYLRIGGEYNADEPLRKRINNIYLKSYVAFNKPPVWRRVLLKAYKYSPALGICLRYCFLKAKNMINKFRYKELLCR